MPLQLIRLSVLRDSELQLVQERFNPTQALLWRPCNQSRPFAFRRLLMAFRGSL